MTFDLVRRPALAVAAVILAVAAAIISPVGTTASADACPDVEVVFARGTAEPPGLGRVGNALVSALRSRIAPRSVGGYGVIYPASRNFLAIGDGAADATGRVQYMADACPDTRMVLGGFSQGAAVIDALTGTPARSRDGPRPGRSCCRRCGFRQPVKPGRWPDHGAEPAVRIQGH